MTNGVRQFFRLCPRNSRTDVDKAVPQHILFRRRQGLPGRNGTGTSVRRCMPDGVRHPGGEADRRSRAKGERRERRAGRSSCRWRPGRGSGPRDRHQPWIIGVPSHPPADGHAGERRGRADRHCRAVNGCRKRPSLTQHHAERQWRSRRTRTLSLCTETPSSIWLVGGAPNRIFCCSLFLANLRRSLAAWNCIAWSRAL